MKWLEQGLLFIILWMPFAAGAHSPSKAPVYLSYEQKWAVLALLANTPDYFESEWLTEKKKIGLILESYSKSPITIEVKSFSEFLTSFRGKWEGSSDFRYDLYQATKWRDPTPIKYWSASAKVQGQIDRYLQKQRRILASSLSQTWDQLFSQTYLSSKVAVTPAVLLSSGARMQLLERALGEFMELGKVELRTFLNQKTHNEIDSSKKFLIEKVLIGYLEGMSWEAKKQMFANFLDLPLTATAHQKIEFIFQSTGPQVQKLLQILARDSSFDRELGQIFQKFENQVRPAPWSLVQQQIYEAIPAKAFISIDKQPLGVGTMAQVHRAKVRWEGETKSVVFRVLKPGIQKRVSEDNKIIIEVANKIDAMSDFKVKGLPKLAPLAEDIVLMVSHELDTQRTRHQQVIGREVYGLNSHTIKSSNLKLKNHIEIYVPRVFNFATGSSAASAPMMQELVLGYKLHEVPEIWTKWYPNLKYEIAKNLIKAWTSELLFGSGFFHADLHFGNILIHPTDERVRVNILDFGMSHRLPSSAQADLMLLGAGLELRRADLVRRSLEGLILKKDHLNFDHIQAVVQEQMERQRGPLVVRQLVLLLMGEGVRFSPEFVAVNRALTSLEYLAKEGGYPFNFPQLAKELGYHHPIRVTQSLIQKGMSWRELSTLGYGQIFGRAKLGRMSVPRCSKVFYLSMGD